MLAKRKASFIKAKNARDKRIDNLNCAHDPIEGVHAVQRVVDAFTLALLLVLSFLCLVPDLFDTRLFSQRVKVDLHKVLEGSLVWKTLDDV